MLELKPDFTSITQVSKVAVHVDDIPQTRAEEARNAYSDKEVEVPANVEVEVYATDVPTAGYHLTESELAICKSHLFGDSEFVLFGQVAERKTEILRVVFYPENN